MRYSTLNVSYGFVAKVTKGAIPFKKCCGKAAYEIAAVQLLAGKLIDTYEIIADGKTIFPNLSTSFIMMFNGKRCGGGMYFTPSSLINDGLLDFSLVQKDYGKCKLIAKID